MIMSTSACLKQMRSAHIKLKFLFYFCDCESGSHCIVLTSLELTVTQAGLKFSSIPLPQPPKYWGHKHVPTSNKAAIFFLRLVGGRTVGAVCKAKFHLQEQDIEVITPAKWLSSRREQGDFIIIEAGRLLALQKKKMALRNHQRRLGKKHFTSVIIWSVRRGKPLKEQSRIPRIIDGSVIGLRWQSRPNDGKGQQRGTNH